MSSSLRSLTVSSLAALLAAGAAGCSVGAGEKYIGKSDVEKQSAVALANLKRIDVAQVPPITCPRDLKAKLGSSMVCSIGSPPKVYDLTVTVNQVSDGRAEFDVKVADVPRANPSSSP